MDVISKNYPNFLNSYFHALDILYNYLNHKGGFKFHSQIENFDCKPTWMLSPLFAFDQNLGIWVFILLILFPNSVYYPWYENTFFQMILWQFKIFDGSKNLEKAWLAVFLKSWSLWRIDFDVRIQHQTVFSIKRFFEKQAIFIVNSEELIGAESPIDLEKYLSQNHRVLASRKVQLGQKDNTGSENQNYSEACLFIQKLQPNNKANTGLVRF